MPLDSKFAAAVVLRMQRMNVRVPAIVTKPLRAALQWLIHRAAMEQRLEDWSTPIVPTRHLQNDDIQPTSGSGPGPSAAHQRAVRAAVPVRRIGGTAGPRCLLATGTLDVGGLEEVVAFLARRLPHDGVHTAVLHASSESAADGLPQGRLGRQLCREGIEAFQHDREAGTRWLKVWRPDVISAHGAPSWVLEAANQLGIPYVETLHMPAFMNEVPDTEGERSRHYCGIVAVSELLKAQYLRLNRAFPADRVVVVPNAVDDIRRTPPDRTRTRQRWGLEDEYVFLSLARHAQQKNGYGLVAAFADVAAKHRKAHLIVAGRPDDAVYLSHVTRLRDSLPCRDRIHLRDHHPDPAQLLAIADGFVLDSFFEGWSLASMEALFAGVPVVLSDVGGAREQVAGDERRGYVVANPGGDPVDVDWTCIRTVRFAPQPNQKAFGDAMCSLVNTRDGRTAFRKSLIADSAARFDAVLCLKRHAYVLATAAATHSLPTQQSMEEIAERSTVLPA